MKTITYLLFSLFTIHALAQYDYEPSSKNPFGSPNPNGPEELNDWKLLIGQCTCKSVSRIDQNTWADTVMMTWTFKYIMNGMAVQDETLKKDGAHSGSIRQFNSDSSKWYVHYYSSSSAVTKLPSWEGSKKENGHIILYREQPAPNGNPGYYRLTFSNISEEGYDWVGEWVNEAETFAYPTWKIFCKKNE
ncbi:hypothetical protein [Ekhidna sp.]|uniref:hypothetical protein n=1 Tax=Ekhidna sp. TaxID=2608089 RepID=UPI003B5A3318